MYVCCCCFRCPNTTDFSDADLVSRRPVPDESQKRNPQQQNHCVQQEVAEIQCIYQVRFFVVDDNIEMLGRRHLCLLRSIVHSIWSCVVIISYHLQQHHVQYAKKYRSLWLVTN